MSSLSLRLPDSLHEAAKITAKKDHVSVNQPVNVPGEKNYQSTHCR